MRYGWLLPIGLMAGAAGAAGPALSVEKAEFFSDRAVDDEFVQSVATTRIPFEPGISCYRWVLRVKPGKQVVPLREILTLPAPAAHWGGVDGDPESATSLTSDRSVGTTSLLDSIDDGELSNRWCVAEGDPEGAYSIEVHTGDRLLHRFEFTVGR